MKPQHSELIMFSSNQYFAQHQDRYTTSEDTQSKTDHNHGYHYHHDDHHQNLPHHYHNHHRNLHLHHHHHQSDHHSDDYHYHQFYNHNNQRHQCDNNLQLGAPQYGDPKARLCMLPNVQALDQIQDTYIYPADQYLEQKLDQEPTSSCMVPVVPLVPGSNHSQGRHSAMDRQISREHQGSSHLPLVSQSGLRQNWTQADRLSHKQLQIFYTLQWLESNYERCDNVCLPRYLLYSHYLHFCKTKSFIPSGAATFGKIIRQKFPKLTTRRLGTRGKSKYHYYGIGIKESSVYYPSATTGKGLTRFSGLNVKTENTSRKYSLSSKAGTLLPEFPDVRRLSLPGDIDRHKLSVFLLMYSIHCQRILDTVISGHFREVETLLLHFWQGTPRHLQDILSYDVIKDIVGFCDSILYQSLVEVSIPTAVQEIPEPLLHEIRSFLKKLPMFMANSLENVPKCLMESKLQVAQGFIHIIRRQLSFVEVAQVSKTVLQNSDVVEQIVEDLRDIHFTDVCKELTILSGQGTAKQQQFFKCYQDLLNLLKQQSPLQCYTNWMDNIVDTFLIKPCHSKNLDFEKCSADFVLNWMALGTLVSRELTMKNAINFGSFHLLRLMFDEYVFLVIETQRNSQRESLLQINVQRLIKRNDMVPLARHEESGRYRKDCFNFYKQPSDWGAQTKHIKFSMWPSQSDYTNQTINRKRNDRISGLSPRNEHSLALKSLYTTDTRNEGLNMYRNYGDNGGRVGGCWDFSEFSGGSDCCGSGGGAAGAGAGRNGCSSFDGGGGGGGRGGVSSFERTGSSMTTALEESIPRWQGGVDSGSIIGGNTTSGMQDYRIHSDIGSSGMTAEANIPVDHNSRTTMNNGIVNRQVYRYNVRGQNLDHPYYNTPSNNRWTQPTHNW